MNKKKITKYNWDELKLEFFKSDFTEIAPFIQQRYSKDTAKNSNIANHTKWWANEKRDFYNSIMKKAIDNYTPDYEKWKKVLIKIENAQLKWLNMLADYILNSGNIIEEKILLNDWKTIINQKIYNNLSIHNIIEIINFIKTYKIDYKNDSQIKITAKEWLYKNKLLNAK